MTKNGKVTTGRICIDSGGSIDVVEDVIIRDRQHLSEDGIILPIIAINKRTGKRRRPPRNRHARLRHGRRQAAHRRGPRDRPAHPRKLVRPKRSRTTASLRKKSATTSSASSRSPLQPSSPHHAGHHGNLSPPTTHTPQVSHAEGLGLFALDPLTSQTKGFARIRSCIRPTPWRQPFTSPILGVVFRRWKNLQKLRQSFPKIA